MMLCEWHPLAWSSSRFCLTAHCHRLAAPARLPGGSAWSGWSRVASPLTRSPMPGSSPAAAALPLLCAHVLVPASARAARTTLPHPCMNTHASLPPSLTHSLPSVAYSILSLHLSTHPLAPHPTPPPHPPHTHSLPTRRHHHLQHVHPEAAPRPLGAAVRQVGLGGSFGAAAGRPPQLWCSAARAASALVRTLTAGSHRCQACLACGVIQHAVQARLGARLQRQPRGPAGGQPLPHVYLPWR